MNRKETLQELIVSFQSMHRGMVHRGSSIKDSIPFGQKAALFTIAMHKTINIKSLASLLHVTPGAATQHVEALVQEGLVERNTDTIDRRNVTITLSKKGSKLAQKFRKHRFEMMEKLFSEISDQELQTYLDITKKITNGSIATAEPKKGTKYE
jgi:DNA-binding MarR family transcriptional regulator